MLRERHRPGIEPGVDHVLHPPHRPLASTLGARPGDLVDERPVRIELRGIVEIRRLLAAGHPEQLLVGADHLLVPALEAAPDGQRRPPVAAARQRPVDHVLQPVAEPPLADVLRAPVDLLVLGDQRVLLLGGADEPAGGGVVEERPVAAPAERIAVAVAVVVEHQAAPLEILDDLGVRVLEPKPGEGAGAGHHLPLAVHREDHRQPVAPPRLIVVLAERRRRVHQPGAVRRRHVVAEHHAAGDLRLEEGVEAVVEQPLEVAPAEGGERRRLAEIDLLPLPVLLDDDRHRRAEVLPQQDEVAGLRRVLHHLVEQVRMDGEPYVGDRGPGGGRPRHQIEVVADLPRLAGGGGLQRLPGPGMEQSPDRGIVRVLVVLGHLVAGEGGAAAGAVGLDLVPLVEQPPRGELREGPPDRLDVGVRVGEVGVVEVHPVPHPLGHRPPLLLVGVDAVEARLIELGDAVGLDLLLAGEPEPLLDLDLDRQPMRVPPRLARHVVAAHRPVAGEEVLDHPRDHMPHVRHVVRRGRPLEEDEFPRRGRLRQGLREDPLGLPPLENPELQPGEGISTRNLRESLVAHQEKVLSGRVPASGAARGGIVAEGGGRGTLELESPRRRSSRCYEI